MPDDIATAAAREAPLPSPELRFATASVPYPQAMAEMEARVAAVADGREPELIWFLEHPPLYTAGTSARRQDLVDPDRFPVFETGRGGQFTYHGPGQRIVYPVLDIGRRGRDLRCYVSALEGWVIATLADFGVTGERRQGRVGVWVVREDGREEKIAAIGVRVRRWVSLHGLSLNVAPDLGHYGGIVPCGIAEHGVTSLAALGVSATMAEVDAALLRHLPAFLARVNGETCALA
ncbi:lipoyl(octanoyl) transferase LipB [Parapedomonas caeni]